MATREMVSVNIPGPDKYVARKSSPLSFWHENKHRRKGGRVKNRDWVCLRVELKKRLRHYLNGDGRIAYAEDMLPPRPR